MRVLVTSALVQRSQGRFFAPVRVGHLATCSLHADTVELQHYPEPSEREMLRVWLARLPAYEQLVSFDDGSANLAAALHQVQLLQLPVPIRIGRDCCREAHVPTVQLVRLSTNTDARSYAPMVFAAVAATLLQPQPPTPVRALQHVAATACLFLQLQRLQVPPEQVAVVDARIEQVLQLLAIRSVEKITTG